ncbi:meiotic chromosome segregation protein [Thozetella sp. PMI_491]|nr:meiotic chromosome segregation protein [Thozetella sp. PMI_491]
MSDLVKGHEVRSRKPVPAYLATKGSPLTVDKDQYATIQTSTRVLTEEFTLDIRSGRAWKATAGSIVRISTPEGPQVGDLNIWNLHNPRERFWASRTRQLHASHLSTHDRLWSTLPYLRPMVTIIADSLSWYTFDQNRARVHDLLGTRCDPYVNSLLSGGDYDFHCHSNLTRAVLPFGLNESDVHDVINLFQVTGLDDKGRYFMSGCPAEAGDYIEFLAEQDVLMALSKLLLLLPRAPLTALPPLLRVGPTADDNFQARAPAATSRSGGFGEDNEEQMIKCCRPLKVEVFRLEDDTLLEKVGWKPAEVAPYKGLHGLGVPSSGRQG